MKRRMWISLVVVPLLLLETTLCTRKVAWGRMESEFRQQLFADATKNPHCSFVVSVVNWRGTTDLATLTPVQLKLLLADVHLQRVVPRTSEEDLPASASLQFAALAGKSNPVSGFYVGAMEGGGSSGILGWSWISSNKWQGLELTLSSCQALRRRIWTQYSAKLRALHVSALP